MLRTTFLAMHKSLLRPRTLYACVSSPAKRHVSSLLDYNHGLSAQTQEFQKLARDFADKELAPRMSELDAKKQNMPHDVLRKGADLGFGAIYCKPDHGGTGLSRLDASVIFEALATGDVSTTAYFTVHNMCTWVIDTFGTTEQKSKYLPKLVTMETLASYCLTEPVSGSDAASLITTAKPSDSGSSYFLNGTKAFISGGGQADIYLVMARTGGQGPKGITCFIVEKGTPGLEFGKREDKMGWNSQPTRMVMLEDVEVPKENVVGEVGQGFGIAMKALDGGRVNIASCSLGGAQAAIETTVDYCKSRTQFGKALTEFESIQHTLSSMVASLHSSRLMTRQAATLLDQESPAAGSFCALAKLEATENCFKVCDDALQLHGGYGYLKDYKVEQYLRDVRVNRILEGTNQVMKMIAARSIIG